MRLLQALFLVAFIGIAGCQRPFSARYSSVEPPRLCAAPVTGEYVLYSGLDRVSCHHAAVLKGESLGFERTRTGDLLAVAGPERWLIEEGSYQWRRSPDPPADSAGDKPGETTRLPSPRDVVEFVAECAWGATYLALYAIYHGGASQLNAMFSHI